MKALSILIALMAVSSFAVAQDPELEKRLEEQRARAIRAQYDSAIFLTDAGEYERADVKYQYVLKNLKSIPSSLAYHFGRNSFMTGKIAQSSDWLNKYIQLKGVSGEHYDDAVRLLEKVNAARLKEREQESAQVSTLFQSRNYDIDCGPTGKVTCPVCSGSAVVVRRSYLGNTYKACTTCSQKGYLGCADFNKLLRGELKPNP